MELELDAPKGVGVGRAEGAEELEVGGAKGAGSWELRVGARDPLLKEGNFDENHGHHGPRR